MPAPRRGYHQETNAYTVTGRGVHVYMCGNILLLVSILIAFAGIPCTFIGYWGEEPRSQLLQVAGPVCLGCGLLLVAGGKILKATADVELVPMSAAAAAPGQGSGGGDDELGSMPSVPSLTSLIRHGTVRTVRQPAQPRI